MKVVRLLVLGTLAARGAMHGHQLKRAIQLINIEAWSAIRVGSLYHALHQMQAEGLIEAVRTERQGALPARTVYEITSEGRLELDVLRDRALRQVEQVRDPFDVALWVAAGVPAAELEAIVRQRLEALRLQHDALATERRQLTEKGQLPPAGAMLMRHGEARLDAEVRWHEELLTGLNGGLLKVDDSNLSS
jgi:DNA-binding PadR family transcriptional regulator